MTSELINWNEIHDLNGYEPTCFEYVVKKILGSHGLIATWDSNQMTSNQSHAANSIAHDIQESIEKSILKPNRPEINTNMRCRSTHQIQSHPL